MYHGERFNTISHIAGAALAAIGGIALVSVACRAGDPWKIVSFAIYGAMLVLLYVCSSMYHGARGQIKAFLRHLDHCAIYLLIAGSYTPFALVTLRGAWGWSIFGSIWALAALGIAEEFWRIGRTRLLAIALYILMGWLVLVAIVPLVHSLGWHGFLWLAAGGVLYSVGVFFYVNKKLRHGHGIWHLFVVGGSACHYLAVLLYVA
ncbi:MAG TPA: hemolysin III family protein [Burkholderiaceae bacterium]